MSNDAFAAALVHASNMTHSLARYTANFTPPTAAFPDA